MHMLRRWEDLAGFSVHTQEGAIGRIDTCHFDASTWTVRYIAVPAKGIVPAGRFLISPIAVVRFDDGARALSVRVSHSQLRRAPCPDLESITSHADEAHFYRHFGWPTYWQGPERWGRTPFPNDINIPREETDELFYLAGNLQPARFFAPGDFIGHGVAARDGAAGRVEHLLIDDESWAVRYLVIEAGKWLSGRRLLISPHWLPATCAGTGDIAVDLFRGEMRNAPPYDPDSFITRDYEQRLFKHYGREQDWHEVVVGRRPAAV